MTRAVAVGPGQVALVPLTYPERLLQQANGVGVTIDGREQDEPAPVVVSGRPYTGWTPPGSTPAPDRPLVLFSLAVDPRFPDWVKAAREARYGKPPPGTPITPAVVAVADTGCVRADRPAESWSPNWIGYSRYDGVVVTADDLRRMPAEVRNAVGQYVECGGVLFVLGPNPQLAGAWKTLSFGKNMPDGGPAGFGQVFVTPQTDLSKWDPAALTNLLAAWNDTLAPWKTCRTAVEANRRFPVVEDVSVPTTGLLILMLAFVLAIGPVNLFVLGRMRRKLWLFWTVPLVSAVTCLAVFATLAVAEGWTGTARVDGLTILDESTRRASSLGVAGYYCPVAPRDGLRFDPGTEVSLQNGEDPGNPYGYRTHRSAKASLALDWTRDQHLTSGWVTPRVPAHFVVRKGETRRERVTFGPGADGKPEAVNGLGADLSDLWYADDAGAVFHAQAVPAGGRAALSPLPALPKTQPGAVETRRRLFYTNGEWSDLPGRVKAIGPELLAPRTYLAVMTAAPFFDEGLADRANRTARQAVLGLLPPPGKGEAK